MPKRVAKLSPGALEEYKDLMSDTKEDLKEHLQRLEVQIQEMSQKNSEKDNKELQTLLEEKQVRSKVSRFARNCQIKLEGSSLSQLQLRKNHSTLLLKDT